MAIDPNNSSTLTENKVSGRVMTPRTSTYLPNVAGAVTWQAEIKNGDIASIILSHHRMNARFNVSGNGINSFEFSEGGKTYHIEFGDDDA
jgi:hypothetical protein